MPPRPEALTLSRKALALPQSRLLARADLPDGKSARKEYAQPLVFIPGELEAWLNTVLPSTLDRSRMERKEQVDLPFEMIREAVVNALIHRDYDITGQKCQLVVNSDAITIKSPRCPISLVTLEQMCSFSVPIKSRTPVLHHVFSRLGMAEEHGFGLASLKKHAEELGLPLPSYSMEGDCVVLSTCPSTKPCFVERALLLVHGKETGRSARLTVLFLDRNLGNSTRRVRVGLQSSDLSMDRSNRWPDTRGWN